MKPNITKPTSNPDGSHSLDMRGSNALGAELATEIFNSHKATQVPIIQMVPPGNLIVTQKQFASLNDYTERMYETTDRMYQTPYGVMEVKIDREIDTVQAIESTIVETEELKKEMHDYDADTHLN